MIKEGRFGTVGSDMIKTCPVCFQFVVIEQINCNIFRCGVFKDTFEYIPPHTSKEQIELWKKAGRIWGCGTAMELVNNELAVCDYK